MTGLATNSGTKPIMIGPITSRLAPVPVTIGLGKSSYDISKGLVINKDEMLLAFYNRYLTWRRDNQPALTAGSSLASIEIMDTMRNVSCEIQFLRTLRIPEDGRVHDPSEFGPFPIVDLSKFENTNALISMRRKGHLAIPMLQREAMCMKFERSSFPRSQRDTPFDCDFAIRIYSGGINTISGKAHSECTCQQQDYYVVPLQKTIHGFYATNEEVKQFVAMPLGGSYSVESQLTGTDSLGGIQFQIAPRMITRVKFQQPRSDVALPLIKTPRELEFRNGQVLQMTETVGMPDIPWEDVNWTSSDDLHTWAYWTQVESPIDNYSRRTRPAYLFDISSELHPEKLGALVVSAVQPITITLVWTCFGEILQSRSVTISPFENVATFDTRLKDVAVQWFKTDGEGQAKVGSEYHDWLIVYPDMVWYKHHALNQSGYIAIHTIGVTDGCRIGIQLVVPGSHDSYVSANSGDGWGMGLAPGGDVRQRIEKDPVPGNWNWESSLLVNLQVLNTVAFESVTGLAPPVTNRAA